MKYLSAVRNSPVLTGFILTLSCVFLWDCSRPNRQEQIPVKQYSLHGTVVSLNPKERTVKVKGDAIPGWMDAMTMDYPVQNLNDWKSLQPGEEISATLEVRDLDYSIRNVKGNSPGQIK